MRMRELLAIAVALFVIFDGCSRRPREASNDEPAPMKPSNVAEILNVEARPDKVPNFSWRDASGAKIDFDHFRGKVTLINFWATWCVPCKKELPDLIALSRELTGKDVKVLGISTDRGGNVMEEVGRFVKEHDIPYQNLISNDAIEEAFGNIAGIPTTFLIDADGRIVQKFVGARPKQFFVDAITVILH